VERPIRIAFTRHAELRAQERGVSLQAAADLAFEHHGRRRRNPGLADWVLKVGGIGVAYDWPVSGDSSVARVVTVFRE